MASILVVEDDVNTQKLTAARLKPYFNVICADNGEDALAILERQRFDLIITDIMMPKTDGYTFVKTLREGGDNVPVLMITAKQSFDDKREGFVSGTDDYMTKPINYEELIWRVNALLRRAKIAFEKQIVIGTTMVNASSYTVACNNETTELPKKEFELLYKLLSYPNKIFTKNQLLTEIWGYDSESGDDTIKTHISRLRAKLAHSPDFEIINVKGLGYKVEIK